jgi:hypothetical protein
MSNFQKLIYHLVLNEFSNSIRGNWEEFTRLSIFDHPFKSFSRLPKLQR